MLPPLLLLMDPLLMLLMDPLILLLLLIRNNLQDNSYQTQQQLQKRDTDNSNRHQHRHRCRDIYKPSLPFLALFGLLFTKKAIYWIKQQYTTNHPICSTNIPFV
mmetsp:Transcript_4850/g.10257  ORF Transcript_4850/g.10257 Transcript_4850/m.10257 type:complete len:104 (-) Transcript_4850:46-357(-)